MVCETYTTFKVVHHVKAGQLTVRAYVHRKTWDGRRVQSGPFRPKVWNEVRQSAVREFPLGKSPEGAAKVMIRELRKALTEGDADGHA